MAPRSAAARAPVPTTSHCWPMPPQETLKHPKAGLAQSLVGSLGPDAHKVLFEPSEHLWWLWGLILNTILPLLPSYWGFSFALGCGVSFFGGIRFSSVHFSCSVVSDSLRAHGLQYARPPCPSPAPGVYSNSCPLSQWCHPTTSSSVIPFSSCLQSFPASGIRLVGN